MHMQTVTVRHTLVIVGTAAPGRSRYTIDPVVAVLSLTYQQPTKGMKLTTVTTAKTGADAVVRPIVLLLVIALACAGLLRLMDSDMCKDKVPGPLAWTAENSLSLALVNSTPMPSCTPSSEAKAGELVTVQLPRPDPRKAHGL